jgi:hypothetical protein
MATGAAPVPRISHRFAASTALALLLAIAAGPGAGGCGKYGSPVRSAPHEAREASAAEPADDTSFEAGGAAEQPAREEDDETRREPGASK